MVHDDDGMQRQECSPRRWQCDGSPPRMRANDDRLVLGAWHALLDHRLALHAHREDADLALVELAARLLATDREALAGGSS